METPAERSPFSQPPIDPPVSEASSEASSESQPLWRLENSPALEPSQWQAVTLGLQLKLIALWVLLAAALVGLIACLLSLSWSLFGASGVKLANASLVSRFLLGGIGGVLGLALLIDIAGRFLPRLAFKSQASVQR